MANWAIELHTEVDAWFLRLAEEDHETADLIEQAIDMLAVRGPTMGRPLVDHIKGSRFRNMKELAPGVSRLQRGANPVRLRSATARDSVGRWRQGGQLAGVVQLVCPDRGQPLCRAPG